MRAQLKTEQGDPDHTGHPDYLGPDHHNHSEGSFAHVQCFRESHMVFWVKGLQIDQNESGVKTHLS